MPICTSNGDGRYTITVREVDTSDLSFSKEDNALPAARYTRMIEDEIQRRSEEWFWRTTGGSRFAVQTKYPGELLIRKQCLKDNFSLE